MKPKLVTAICVLAVIGILLITCQMFFRHQLFRENYHFWRYDRLTGNTERWNYTEGRWEPHINPPRPNPNNIVTP